MTNLMIEAVGLHKSFGETHALAGLDFDAEGGHDPLHAGSERGRQDDGGADPHHADSPRRGDGDGRGHRCAASSREVRDKIGVAGQYAALDELLTGRENLGMVGRLYRVDAKDARTAGDALIEHFELTDAADRIVKNYSGGMRRRLDLGAALMAEPPGDLPGRADDRAGSEGTAFDVGPDRRAGQRAAPRC